MATWSMVCCRSLVRKRCMLSSLLSPSGSAAYWAAARHLQLLLAAARRAGATTRVPAVLVGYWCLTPLARARLRMWYRCTGALFTITLCTMATE